MINLKLIYKIIGSLLFIEAMMLVVCLGVSYTTMRTTSWHLPAPLLYRLEPD